MHHELSMPEKPDPAAVYKPLPEVEGDTTVAELESESSLDQGQSARIAALQAARELFLSITPFGTAISTRIHSVDLVAVAQYIMDGKDPWAKSTAERVDDLAQWLIEQSDIGDTSVWASLTAFETMLDARIHGLLAKEPLGGSKEPDSNRDETVSDSSA